MPKGNVRTISCTDERLWQLVDQASTSSGIPVSQLIQSALRDSPFIRMIDDDRKIDHGEPAVA